MLKSLVVIAALAFAAPGLAVADDNNKPPSFTDLTANDPPPILFTVRPGCRRGLEAAFLLVAVEARKMTTSDASSDSPIP